MDAHHYTDSTCEIQLTRGYVAIIDAADYALVSQYKWCAATEKKGNGRTYALGNAKQVNGKWKTVRMHRLITNPPRGLQVDHINGNGLDNRRANLRLATWSQNMANQSAQPKRAEIHSQYKGVSWVRKCCKWVVRIRFQGKMIYLGMFKDEEAAAHTYDVAALHYFGEFAYVNFKSSGGT